MSLDQTSPPEPAEETPQELRRDRTETHPKPHHFGFGKWVILGIAAVVALLSVEALRLAHHGWSMRPQHQDPKSDAKPVVEKLADGFLEGPELRKELSEATAGTIGAKSGYLPLKWNGLSAYSEGFLAEGLPGRALKAIRASGLNARCDLGEIAKKKIRIDQFSVQHCQAAFSDEGLALLKNEISKAPELYPPTGKDSAFSVDMREIVLSQADLYYGDPGKSGGEIHQATMTFWPDGKNLVGQGYGGAFRQAGFPEAKIGFFQVYYAAPILRFDAGSLAVGDSGRVELGGQFAFTQPGNMDLMLRFRNCDADDFVKGEMRSKFSATFDGDIRVQQELGPGGKPAAEGSVAAHRAVVKKIEALAKVADFTGEKAFRALPLQQVRLQFHWEADDLKVEKFEAESRGILKVEGEFTIRKEAIHGVFQLGVSPRILDSFPGAREEVFTKVRDGYHWTTVKVSGPLEKPSENLKERLVAAAEKHFAKALLAPLFKPGREILLRLRELF